MPCFARCLTRHWLHLHRARLPHLLCCYLYTGLPLPLRKLDSCLADLPNSLRSHSERIGNQSWFCQRYRSDSKLWMSWRSQEPVLSVTKNRSWTCSLSSPRTHRKKTSQSALLNKSLLYQRHGFGRKLWNCGSHAVHSTESRPWTCPLPAACGSCWGDHGMRWNLKECNEMVRILSTEF